jgi:hypothetical protein
MTKRRPAWVWIAIATMVIACGSGPAPTSPGPAFATFDGDGLSLEYPVAWQGFRHESVSSFSSLIVDLGTVDVPAPCISTPNAFGGSDTACADRFHLAPDTLVVHVSANGFPGFDIVRSRPPLAVPVVVAGRAAFVEQAAPDNPMVGADLVISWTIDRPEAPSNSYTVVALIRGPDIEPFKAQLQQLVQSLRFRAG